MSLIAIISDTHDNVAGVTRAVEEIRNLNPELVIHCGDITKPETLALFRGLPLQPIFGNCDWLEAELITQAKELGISRIDHELSIEIAGKRIFAYHGTRSRLLSEAIDSERYDYVFHGHTHLAGTKVHGRTRVLNPGAFTRVQRCTFATLNLATDEYSFIEIP